MNEILIVIQILTLIIAAGFFLLAFISVMEAKNKRRELLEKYKEATKDLEDLIEAYSSAQYSENNLRPEDKNVH